MADPGDHFEVTDAVTFGNFKPSVYVAAKVTHMTNSPMKMLQKAFKYI
jgi:hypothetical protein